MLVEIPDLDVILGSAAAFVVGVIGVFLIYKIKPYINIRQGGTPPAYMERLEYYERQLIDMKIRLDALDVMDAGTGPAPAGEEMARAAGRPKEGPKEEEIIEARPQKQESVPAFGRLDITEHVLRLITDKSMTSRDIQVTIGRTREHTSRLMKKLYDDGLVERHTGTKPYTYSISDMGREKVGQVRPAQVAA